MARARDVAVVSIALAMLCLPLILTVGGTSTFSLSENRMLAPMPKFPTSLRQLSAFPVQADAFLRDHLGLRDWMRQVYASIIFRVERIGNTNVLLGQDGWLFYRGGQNLEKSAGLYRREDQIMRTVEILAAMQRDLTRQGGLLRVAPPPSNATIEMEMLPVWARNHGRLTEYDLLLTALSARGFPALDLRPALRAAKGEGPVYHRHDTHWTPRGAISALNAVLEWSGAGWLVDPAAVLGPPEAKIGGDEAKMLGLENQFSEIVEPLLRPHRPIAEPVDQLPYREAGGRDDGRRILILGDSFTYSFFAPVLRPGVREVLWWANRSCDFDWEVILAARPDEVWWMPTERGITCEPGVKPLHLAVSGD